MPRLRPRLRKVDDEQSVSCLLAGRYAPLSGFHCHCATHLINLTSSVLGTSSISIVSRRADGSKCRVRAPSKRHEPPSRTLGSIIAHTLSLVASARSPTLLRASGSFPGMPSVPKILFAPSAGGVKSPCQRDACEGYHHEGFASRSRIPPPLEQLGN